MSYKTIDQVAERAAEQVEQMDAAGKVAYLQTEFRAFVSANDRRKESFNKLADSDRVRTFDTFRNLVNQKSNGAFSNVYDFSTEMLYQMVNEGQVKLDDLPDEVMVAMAPILKNRGSQQYPFLKANLKERVKDSFYGQNPNSALSKISSAILSPFGYSVWEKQLKEDYAADLDHLNVDGELKVQELQSHAAEMMQRRKGIVQQMNRIATEDDGLTIDTIESVGGLIGLFGGSTAAYRQLQRYGMASLLKVATQPKRALKTLGAQAAAETAIAAPFSEGPADTFKNAALGIGFGVAGDKAIDLAGEAWKRMPQMSALWGNAVDRFGLDTLKRWAQPMSARVEKISPQVANEVRRFLMRTNIRAQNAQDIAADFLHSVENNMGKKEVDQLYYLLAKGDRKGVNQMFAKKGEKAAQEMRSRLARVDDVNARFLQDAQDAGMDVGEIPDYWARRIREDKYQQFLKDKGINESDRRFQQMLRDAEIEYGRPLDSNDKAALLNKYMTQGTPERLPSSSNVKQRKMRDLDYADYSKYYDRSDKAMMKYYENMAMAIEKRNFFGTGIGKPARGGKPVRYEYLDESGNVFDSAYVPQPRRDLKVDNGVMKYNGRTLDLEQTIGAHIQRLVDAGQLRPEQMDELTDLMKTVFAGPGSTHKWSKGLSLITYGAMMGQFDTAALQLTDFAIEAAKSNPRVTFKALTKQNFGDVGLQSIGLEGLQMDIIDRSMRDGAPAKAIDAMFKATGLRQVDAVMKGMSARAGLEKYLSLRGKSMGDKVVQDFIEQQRKWFGQDTEQLAYDLTMLPKKIQDGHLTEDMRLLMFNNLSQHQPISIFEYPEQYLKNGGSRFLYSLKSFMLKYIDNANRLTLREWKAGNKMKALRNTVTLGAFMGASQTGFEIGREFVYDQIRALADGRVEDLGEFYRDKRDVYWDAAADGMLNAAGANRYLIDKGVADPGGTLVNFVVGPSPKIATDVYKTGQAAIQALLGTQQTGMSDYKAIKYIPFIGRSLDRTYGGYRKWIDSGSSDYTMDPLGGMDIGIDDVY